MASVPRRRDRSSSDRFTEEHFDIIEVAAIWRGAPRSAPERGPRTILVACKLSISRADADLSSPSGSFRETEFTATSNLKSHLQSQLPRPGDYPTCKVNIHCASGVWRFTRWGSSLTVIDWGMCQNLKNAASQGLLALDQQAAEQEPDGEQTCGLTGIKAACYAPVLLYWLARNDMQTPLWRSRRSCCCWGAILVCS